MGDSERHVATPWDRTGKTVRDSEKDSERHTATLGETVSDHIAT